MKYILEGNDKELERVLREQRIRMGRGMIQITPIPGTLVSEEDALKAIEAKTEELTASLAGKDGLIASLTGECDTLKARVAELEAGLVKDETMPETDNKKVDAEDDKNLNIADSKHLPDDDSMFVDIDADTDNKKTKKK